VGPLIYDAPFRRLKTSGASIEGKHRGFAFVTYSSPEDAQDAIDNMDLNELRGRVVKVSLARPMKTPAQLGGNRAGSYGSLFTGTEY
jgi:RNA recognition motif-containing protein